MESYQPGQALDVAALLKEGETVDVAGVTVGKGFQGRQRQAASVRGSCCTALGGGSRAWLHGPRRRSSPDVCIA